MSTRRTLLVALSAGVVVAAVASVAAPSQPAGAAARGWAPSASSTGVPAGTRLTVVSGNVTLRAPGVYSGFDFRGFVSVAASNVTIKNSIFRGGRASTNHFYGMVQSLQGYKNLVVQDSEIFSQYPSVWVEGIKGWNFTGIRLDIHDVTDGIKILGDNVTVRDSFVHNLLTFPRDPNYGYRPTHSDGAQIVSGHNITLTRNTIVGGYNSAIQVTQDHGTAGNLHFDNNWLGGGGCSVNIASKPLGAFSSVTINNNTFFHNSQFNCPIIIDTNVGHQAVGNSWSDNAKFKMVARARR